jgi:hypothetical protein
MSVLKSNGNVEFKQAFRTHRELPGKQDYSSFRDHIQRCTDDHVAVFPNMSGDTLLVIPMPLRGKNYATLRDFIDEAPLPQQQAFWKEVAHTARYVMQEAGRAWISVHGMGVPYTHVRVSATPKYYFDAALSKS